jgi:hypothetical protein
MTGPIPGAVLPGATPISIFSLSILVAWNIITSLRFLDIGLVAGIRISNMPGVACVPVPLIISNY